MSDAAPFVLVLHGNHVPKARPKSSHQRGKTRHYMPANYRDCVSSYRQQMRSAWGRDPYPKHTPLRLEVKRYVQRPKSKPPWVPADVWSDGRAFFAPSGVGDFDNIAGTVADAGNGILWHDDCQVVIGWVAKVYMADDDPEGSRVVMSVVGTGWFG